MIMDFLEQVGITFRRLHEEDLFGITIIKMSGDNICTNRIPLPF